MFLCWTPGASGTARESRQTRGAAGREGREGREWEGGREDGEILPVPPPLTQEILQHDTPGRLPVR